MTFFYKKRRARWHKEWGSEWYRIRWPWWIWALILPFKSHMTLSKSYSLSLLIKWKKRISQIHRNFERIKLDNINEKSSEIINTCKQRLGSWVYWKQTTTLNLSAPFFKLKCKKNIKHLKCAEVVTSLAELTQNSKFQFKLVNLSIYGKISIQMGTFH